MARAVESALSQTLPVPAEVIVVNDSGQALPPESWQEYPCVRLLSPKRVGRSSARNRGAACSQGAYLHFLDDDDWLIPGSLAHLIDIAQQSRDLWIFGDSQLVDRQGVPTLMLRHRLPEDVFIHTMSGEWIPLQSSIIHRSLFEEIGGFHKWLAGPEDIDLARRAARSTDFTHSPNPISAIGMGPEDSSTNWANHSHQSRAGRELILDDQQTLPRLLTSAESSYWRGRLFRIYLTSALWNIRHGKWPKTFRRFEQSLRIMRRHGSHVFQLEFWDGVTHAYQSKSFTQIAP